MKKLLKTIRNICMLVAILGISGLISCVVTNQFEVPTTLVKTATSEALEEDKKVVFKEWGTFEKRERKARKVLVPMWEKPIYTEPREAIKFRAGKSLIEIANGDTDE